MPRMPALTSICAACILATWAKPPSVRMVVKTSSPIISPRSKSRKLGATLDVVDLLGGDPRRDGLGGPHARGGRCRRGALPQGGEEQRFVLTTVVGRMARGRRRNYWDQFHATMRELTFATMRERNWFRSAAAYRASHRPGQRPRFSPVLHFALSSG